MQVICRYCDVSAWSLPERFERGLAALPWQARRDKVLRFKFEKDRLLCLGAGLLAAYVLKEAGAEDLEMAYSESGKPYLLHEPAVRFNLSHSGTTAVCAAGGTEVGVDTEGIRRYSPAVARRCFTEDEMAFLERSSDRDDAFTQLWTRKESLLKMLGTGLKTDPRTVSVLPGDPASEGVSEGVSEGGPFFAEHMTGGVRICVCTAEPAEVCFAQWQMAEACFAQRQMAEACFAQRQPEEL